MKCFTKTKLSLLSTILCAALVVPAFFGIKTFAAEPDPEDHDSGVSATLYDSSNGLPTSESNGVAQTPDGYIWVGCYSGLYRYDGQIFTHIDSDERLTSIVTVFADSEGRLWIGTNDNGACVSKDGEYVFYDHESGLSSDTIKAFEEDENGNIVIATTAGLAYVTPEGELSVIDDERINSEYIQELRREGGDIYGTTIDGEFFSVHDLKVRNFFSDEAFDFEANCIYPDPDHEGRVYIGTRESELIYADMADEVSVIRRYNLAPQVAINAVTKTDSYLWICAGNGIGYLDTKSGHHMLEDLPMDNSVYHMMRDVDGNLWFTSTRQGLLKVVRNRFIDIGKKAGLESGVVNSTWLMDDLLYVGMDTGLIILDRDYDVKKNDLTEYLAGCRIRSIKEDAEGNLYFATFSDKGLVIAHKDGTIDSKSTERGFFPTNRVRTSLLLQNGDMLVSVSGGVFRMHDGKVLKVYNEESGLENIEVLSLSEDKSGKLLFGTDGNGLYLVDENDNIRHFTKEDGLTSEVILMVKYDKEQDVHWIMSSNSLGYFNANDNTIKIVNNFPYSNNFDIFPDGRGHYWVLSSNGIYVVSESDLLGNIANMNYLFYNLGKGMPAITTANSRNFLGSDGTLYIAGSTGVFAVNIDKAFSEGELPKIVIPSLEVNGEEVFVGKRTNVIIPSNTKRLTINASALSYGLDDPTISYRLQGFDDKELSGALSTMDAIRYTNLDGGTYVFSYSVLDPLTGEKAETKTLTITKEKSIFEQALFWIIVVAALGGLVVYLTRLADKKKTEALMKEAEEERKKAEEKRELINQIVKAFAKCIDSKDRYTNGHSFRVAQYTKMTAEWMGRFTEEEIENYYNIGLLHDIGKISIPDAVLNKPDALDDKEFEIMKSHAERGFDILSEIKIMPDLALGAGYHHEYLDGKGYPKGLSGDEKIPFVAQIIAVADAFDAMNTDRVYRKALPKEVILEELKKSRGVRLNAEAVDAFIELLNEGKIGFKNKGDKKK